MTVEPKSGQTFDAGQIFDDGKAPDALRTIGEVAGALGIRQHVLRYWEEQFPMLRPVKRSGGRRYYRPEDVALVQMINRLVNAEGYTLRGARGVLESGSAPSVPLAAASPMAALSSNAESLSLTAATLRSADAPVRLRAIRDRLAAALAAD